jgi:hypothetical protein
MNSFLRTVAASLSLSGSFVVSGSAAQHPAMPAGMTHEQHLAQMDKDSKMKTRGAAAMGFDQDAVAHHFTLSTDGGTIRVEVRDAADEASRQAIQKHLEQIAKDFAKGSFEAPLATHAEVPPGVPTLQRLGTAVAYTFERTASGGTVRITTSNEDGVKAIHDFLRYQIREHQTGDPLGVRSPQ